MRPNSMLSACMSSDMCICTGEEALRAWCRTMLVYWAAMHVYCSGQAPRLVVQRVHAQAGC